MTSKLIVHKKQSIIQKRKQPSKILLAKIDACISGFKKLKDAINDALEQGRKEGFTDQQIASVIRYRLDSAGFSRRTITEYLPAEAKLKPRGRPGSNKGKHKALSANISQTSVTKAEKPFNALGLVQKAMSGLADTEIEKPRKSRFEELEEEEEAEEREEKARIKYELEPEEKDLDELLVWENDLPGFPPQLLLRYTVQLIKLCRELQLHKLQMDAIK